MPNIFADIKSVLDALFIKMQPRWTKGFGAVIATHAIVRPKIFGISIKIHDEHYGNLTSRKFNN